jgi:hypothetical protein
VLLLLDACRSAGLIGGARSADILRSSLDINVTVMTTADKVSRENEKSQHGAFTKVIRYLPMISIPIVTS